MMSMASLQRARLFRPFGSSPAVNLTQLLPPRDPAKVLLLGCGDVCHLLFTTHNDDRPLDFTCCDVEPAIIARSIIILTLIIDSKEPVDADQVWSIYLHFKISSTTLQTLRDHIQKLVPLFKSANAWRRGQYGTSIEFCDEGSLKKVYETLDFWMRATPTELASYINRSRDQEKSIDAKCRIQGPCAMSPAFTIHSAVGSVIEDFPIGYTHFWMYGTTENEREVVRNSTKFNPCFVPLQQDSPLSQDLHPFSRFHLAAGYIPSEENKACKPNLEADYLAVMANIAKREFSGWVESFRKQASSITVRYFVGDALAFCTLLQKHADESEPGKDCVYRDRVNFEPVILDGSESEIAQELASSGFDVIDTSSLADEFGALPLFTAVRPLLKDSPSAAIYTDMHLGRESSSKKSLEALLCGELQTISALVGLVLVDVATNNSALFGDELSSIGTFSHYRHKEPEGRQVQISRLTWKCPFHEFDPELLEQGVPRMIVLQDDELANILHGIWHNMFIENEDSTSKDKSLQSSSNNLSLPIYQYSNFIALLGFFTRKSSSGGYAGAQCMQKVLQDTSPPQHHKVSVEILQYLYMLGLSTSGFETFLTVAERPVNKGLQPWEDVPPIVAVTLEVPRAHLSIFTADQDDLSSPLPIECWIKNLTAKAKIFPNPTFAELRMGFGIMSTKGKRNTSSFKVEIEADPAGWSGKSPLFVSFYAPANYLLSDGDGALLSLRLSPSKYSSSKFASKLGQDLNIFEANSEDDMHVYITKYLPGLSSQALPCIMKNRPKPAVPKDGQKINNIVSAYAENDAQRITSISSRAEILDKRTRKLLQGGCAVKSQYLTPFTQEIILDDSMRFLVGFPIPVSESAMKLRVARKSSYIELVANTTRDFQAPSSFKCPILCIKNGPLLWNIPRVNLAQLPHLLTNDLSFFGALSWLVPHLAMSMTPRERSFRESTHQAANKNEGVLAGMKDTIFSMFMSHTGLQGEQSSTIMLVCPEDHDASVVVFISSFRLDPANRTVVLDAALLPSSNMLPQTLSRMLYMVRQVVSREELHMWKRMFPVLAERCRTWEHKPSCEYTTYGKIPTTLQPGKDFLCSCGQGKFPKDFKLAEPQWNLFSKSTTRVAISPIFFSPLVEKVYVPPLQIASADGFRGMMSLLGGLQFGGSFAGVPSGVMDTLGAQFCQLMQHAGSGPEMKAGVKDSIATKCQFCGKSEFDGAGGVGLPRCARCMEVSYCSKGCQTANWKTHRAQCGTRSER